jgi:hypothetical protein
MIGINCQHRVTARRYLTCRSLVDARICHAVASLPHGEIGLFPAVTGCRATICLQSRFRPWNESRYSGPELLRPRLGLEPRLAGKGGQVCCTRSCQLYAIRAAGPCQHLLLEKPARHRPGVRRRSRRGCRTGGTRFPSPRPARSASASVVSFSAPCAAGICLAVASRSARLRAASARGGPHDTSSCSTGFTLRREY